MPTTEDTDKQRLATILLGRPVHEWITEQRSFDYSWRAIADLLENQTGGQIVISHESVRQWFES